MYSSQKLRNVLYVIVSRKMLTTAKPLAHANLSQTWYTKSWTEQKDESYERSSSTIFALRCSREEAADA